MYLKIISRLNHKLVNIEEMLTPKLLINNRYKYKELQTRKMRIKTAISYLLFKIKKPAS